MREIKFRAWDGLNNKFSYWTINDLCTYAEKSEKPSALDDWQQYTGLKDKNGVEIYEGDIVSHNGTNVIARHNPVLLIEFLNGAFCLSAQSTQVYRNNEGEKIGKSCTIMDLMFEARRHNKELALQVIGNIYENPNLLTTNNEASKRS